MLWKIDVEVVKMIWKVVLARSLMFFDGFDKVGVSSAPLLAMTKMLDPYKDFEEY